MLNKIHCEDGNFRMYQNIKIVQTYKLAKPLTQAMKS
jgi:hypothetical protein